MRSRIVPSRTTHPIEEARWVVPLTVFFGFLVNAVSHAWLLLRDDPLVREHRGTLQFRSAWIGDGVLLPVINVAAGKLLAKTDRSQERKSLALGVAISAFVTSAIHVIQAKRGLVNWSMPEPWRWNALGYYHLAFMWLQLGWVGFALVQAGRSVRTLGAAGLGLLGLIFVSLGLFSAVLQLDYPAASVAAGKDHS